MMMHTVINAYILASASGGPESSFSVRGATEVYPLGGTISLSANTRQMHQHTAPSGVNPTISSVYVRFSSTTAAGIKCRPVIYADSAGSLGALIAQGDEYTTTSMGSDTEVELTFPTPATITAGSAFWVGIFGDGTLVFTRSFFGPTLPRRVSDTYSDGAADPSGTGSASGVDPIMMWAILEQAGAPAGSGFISHSVAGNPTSVSGACRVALPDGYAMGDILIAHIEFFAHDSLGSQQVSSANGMTLIDTEQCSTLAYCRTAIYYYRITGTEDGVFEFEPTGYTGNNDTNMVVLSLWRAVTESDPPYEDQDTNTGFTSTATASAVTTSGPNRLLLNFWSFVDNNTPGSPGAGWTNAYSEQESAGSADATAICSYRLEASATTVSADSRTIGAVEAWRTFSLALIPS